MAMMIVNRILYALLVALAATSLVFGLLHIAGDPLAALVPPGSSLEQEASLREHYGLDESLFTQYTRFISSAATGDFGDSWIARRPAMEVVLERFPDTLLLASLAMGLAIVVAIPLGLGAATHPGGFVSWLLTVVSTLTQGIPAFWLGTLLVLLFAVRWQLLPASGAEGWRSLVLPVITLAAYPVGVLSRLCRDTTQAEMTRDFVRTARSKGLTETTIRYRHLLPNALLPVIALIGVQFAFLIGGSVAVEWVFAYPGVGQLALQAVSNRDVPVVLAFVSLIAMIIALVSMLVDIFAALVDPRLRTHSNTGGFAR